MKASSDGRPQVSCDRRQEIAELAEGISEDYFPRDFRINPESIIQNKSITLSYGRYADAFDGMLEYRARRFHIYCNLDRVESREAPRARFTLCHELAHFFIDEHRTDLESGRTPAHPSRCDFESRNPVEQEADHFASNLLMPTGKFRQRAARVQRGLAGVLALTSDFGTSITSTAIRYVQIEPLPCAIIKWGDQGRAWSWVSDKMAGARFRRTISESSAIPKDAATRRALAGEIPPVPGFFQNGSTAAAWFASVADDGYRNLILIEQAFRLGRFGVLTFLYPESGRFDL